MKKIVNESKTEDLSPSRSYDPMQIKNIFTAVNSATRVNKLKFQIRGCSSIALACVGGNLNRGLNKLRNLNSFYSILPKLRQAIYRRPNRHNNNDFDDDNNAIKNILEISCSGFDASQHDFYLVLLGGGNVYL